MLMSLWCIRFQLIAYLYKVLHLFSMRLQSNKKTMIKNGQLMDDLMKNGSPGNSETLIFIYNIYRLLLIFILYLLLYANNLSLSLTALYLDYFSSVLICYLLISLCLTMYSISFRKNITNTWFILSGLTDITCINLLILASGNYSFGVLLIFFVAAQSILIPGRLSMGFAALATLVLLVITWLKMIYIAPDIDNFYNVAMLGSGLFATALTSLVLANRVRTSNRLALERQSELVESQSINAFIIERFFSGVILIDDQKHIRLINKAALTMLGTKSALTQLPEKIDDKINQWKQQKSFYQTSKRAIIEQPDVLLYLIPVKAHVKTPVLIIMEDMAHYIKQVQELKLVSLGRFTSSMAHELRNPLGAISHASQLMSESKNLSQIEEKLLTIIDKNCAKMNVFIKNILQLSRKEKVKAKQLKLIDEIKSFKDEYNQLNKLKNLAIDVILDDDEIEVFFDKNQFHQILTNLADNSKAHGGVDNLVITIEVINKEEGIYLLFKDNGKGISKRHLANIFDPFYTSSKEGTGLGLFIAKELCEINKTKLSYLMDEQGACFMLKFNAEDEVLL